jgi:proteic killer suppression protein
LKILFASKKLQKLANDEQRMLQQLGKKRAILFRRRLTQLEDAGNLQALYDLPGRFHKLSGNRNNQWACDLDQPYRLNFTPVTDDSSEIKAIAVEIIEIVDYH